jgi:uncharacterized protein with PQ loop repeat
MNVLLIVANVINLVYNLPQMVHTYRTKSTKDFNTWFIVLRIVGNSIWVIYAAEVKSTLMLINNTVSVLSSIFIGYYKFINYYNEQNAIIPEGSCDSNLVQRQ